MLIAIVVITILNTIGLSLLWKHVKQTPLNLSKSPNGVVVRKLVTRKG